MVWLGAAVTLLIYVPCQLLLSKVSVAELDIKTPKLLSNVGIKKDVTAVSFAGKLKVNGVVRSIVVDVGVAFAVCNSNSNPHPTKKTFLQHELIGNFIRIGLEFFDLAILKHSQPP